jgi:ATP-dependent Clp protease protease subunit
MKKIQQQKLSVMGVVAMFHEAGLYFPSRTVYFGGTSPWEDDVVTSNNVSAVIKNLHILECHKIAPIQLLLNTVGGSWDDGIIIYDVIRAMKSPVIIIGMGKVYSMGSIIMQAGDKRVLTENTHFMIHDGSDGYQGHAKNFEKWAEYSKTVRKKMYEIYYERMKETNKKITLAEIEKMCAFDSIFTADEAITLGLADEKVEKVTKNVRKT